MWLSILNFLFGWAIKAWQARGPSRLETVNQQLGAVTEDLHIQQKADDNAKDAMRARDNVQSITVDSLPNHTPANDPDFRD